MRSLSPYHAILHILTTTFPFTPPVQAHSQQPQHPAVIQLPMKIFQSQPNGFFMPIVSLGLGSPPQSIKALFDTGSSDLITPETNSALCPSPIPTCAGASQLQNISYSPPYSNTSVDAGVPLNTSFANGQAFQGRFVNDAMTMGGAIVPKAQFGLMQTGELAGGSLFSIFGAGPVQGEAAGSLEKPRLYPNVPAALKEQGLITTNTFAVYMNDFRNGQGQVTFGGIDRSKFEGNLSEAPVLSVANGDIPSFVVDFKALSLSGCGRDGSMSTEVDLSPRNGLPVALIDTGNPLVSIPASSARMLARQMGIGFDAQNGFDPMPCDVAGEGMTLDFAFGPLDSAEGAKVSVPMGLLLVPAESVGLTASETGQYGAGEGEDSKRKQPGHKSHSNERRGQQGSIVHARIVDGYTNPNRGVRARFMASDARVRTRRAMQSPTGMCFLAIDASGDDLASIGAPFFQAAYVVFSMDPPRLLMAQAIVNATGSSELQTFP